MEQILGNPPYYLKFLIILPFWIEVPNYSKFYKQYNSKNYEIEVLQDKWLINIRTEIDSLSFIASEKEVIDPDYIMPKLEFEDLYPLRQIERKLNLKRQYFPKKLKTVLSIIIKNQDFQDNNELYGFLRDPEINIWEDIKNLIRFFLSNYTYFKISSNRAFHRVRPLSEKYFTPEKVFVYYVSKSDKIENFIDIGTSILHITKEYSFPNFLTNKKTFRKLKSKIFLAKELKIRLRERLRILIDFAKMLRDLNSLIVNTVIYLEKVSISYLELKRKLKTWELDILFKYKGLRHFVESQLPWFINEEEYSILIPKAIEIVNKRNDIIHLGVVFPYDESIEQKCYEVLKLISYMENSLKNKDYKMVEYIFDLNFLAHVDFEEPTVMDIIRIIIPNSKTEFEYIRENQIRFEERLELELNGFTEFEIEDRYKPFSRVYNLNNDYIILLALFPTRISTSLKSFILLLQNIAPEIKPNNINFKFFYSEIPPKTFKLLKEAFRLEIEKYKKMLNYKSYYIEYIKINTNNHNFNL